MTASRENALGPVGAVAQPAFPGKPSRVKLGDQVVGYARQRLDMLVAVDEIGG